MADQTLVALYDDAASARQVLDELRAAGLPHDRFWISGNATGTADLGSSRLTDFVGDFAKPESRVRSLTRLGVPEDEATGAAAVRITDYLSRDLTIVQGKGSVIHTQWSPEGWVRIAGRVVNAGITQID